MTKPEIFASGIYPDICVEVAGVLMGSCP